MILGATNREPEGMPVWPLTVLYLVAKKVDPFNPKGLVVDDKWKEYSSKIVDILRSHGIEYTQSVDHQIIGVAGGPMLDDSDTENLIWAALEIQEWLNRMNALAEGFPYQYRIGIHTDKVVAGIVDSARMPYDLYSHALHVGQRMARCCRFGTINVSQYTYAYIEETFQCEFWGSIDSMGEVHKPTDHVFKKAVKDRPDVRRGWIGMYELKGKKKPTIKSEH